MSFHKYSLCCNGSNYVTLGNISDFKVSEHTWGFWIRMTGSGGYILGDGVEHYAIRAASGIFEMRYKDGTQSQQTVQAAEGQLFRDKWRLLSFSTSQSGGVVTKMCVDGRTFNHQIDGEGYDSTYGTAWQIGALNGTTPLHGLLSGAFMVGRAMGTDELRALARHAMRPQDIADVVSFWPMDEGPGSTTISDVVGGHDGTLYSASMWCIQTPSCSRGQV